MAIHEQVDLRGPADEGDPAGGRAQEPGPAREPVAEGRRRKAPGSGRGASVPALGEPFAHAPVERRPLEAAKLLADEGAHAGERGTGDLPRLPRRPQVRIRVEPGGRYGPQALRERGRQEVGVSRGAEADGVREAGLEGDPMMGDAGRKVQQVTGPEHPLGVRPEVPQNAEVEAGAEGGVGPALDPPTPPAQSLEQEHVVAVDVRPHRAEARGKADHHVVDAPVGEKAEALAEARHRGDVAVDPLDEQRPMRGREGPQPARVLGSGHDLEGSRPALDEHEPRLDVLVAGEACELVGGQGVAEARQGASDQQRSLLPVAAQERGGRAAAEQAAVRATHVRTTGIRSRRRQPAGETSQLKARRRTPDRRASVSARAKSGSIARQGATQVASGRCATKTRRPEPPRRA